MALIIVLKYTRVHVLARKPHLYFRYVLVSWVVNWITILVLLVAGYLVFWNYFRVGPAEGTPWSKRMLNLTVVANLNLNILALSYLLVWIDVLRHCKKIISRVKKAVESLAQKSSPN